MDVVEVIGGIVVVTCVIITFGFLGYCFVSIPDDSSDL